MASACKGDTIKNVRKGLLHTHASTLVASLVVMGPFSLMLSSIESSYERNHLLERQEDDGKKNKELE